MPRVLVPQTEQVLEVGVLLQARLAADVHLVVHLPLVDEVDQVRLACWEPERLALLHPAWAEVHLAHADGQIGRIAMVLVRPRAQTRPQAGRHAAQQRERATA